MRSLLFSSLLIAFSLTANAQIDPSSALLLNSGRTVPVRESGIDSGRYTVRPRAEQPVRQEKPARVIKQTTETSSTSAVDTEQAQVIQTQTVQTQTVQTQTVQGPEVSPTPGPVPVAATPTATPVQVVAPVAKTAARQLTMIDLSIAPGYLYNDSSSSFAYRDYNLSAPVLGIDANVWFAPSFGLHAGFMGTSNASVSDSLDHQRSVSVTEQWFLVGLRARKFFGTTDLAPSLTFGVDYQEYQFRVPSDSVLRAKLTTTGPVLSLETELPSSATMSWILGATYAPKLNHKETSNATDFSTGRNPGSSSIGLSLGSRYRFDQTHSVFWKFSQTVEKNTFDGSTSVADPSTGQTQTGVGVTNTTTLFQLGYTWAD